MQLSIRAIGIFRCKSNSESDTIRIIEEGDLSEYEGPHDVTYDLLSTLTTRDFLTAKNARVHKFTQEAEKPRDVRATSTRDLLDDLTNGKNIKQNFETLAKWYHQTDYAQSGLLIVALFSNEGRNQVGIMKAPFMDDAYEAADDEEVLTKMDSVIKGDLRKGILYPRITPDKTVESSEACIYQVQGSSKYAEHWYKYLHLEPSQTANELLDQELAEEPDETPIAEAESTDQFKSIRESLDEEVSDAVVTVEIDNKEVKVRLSELLDREDINLVQSDRGHHLVLSGGEPTVKFFSSRENEFRQILQGLDEYDDIEQVFG